MPRLLYCCAAVILGALWHVAWLISLLPRMPGMRLRFPEAADFFDPAFLLMCAVSLTLAVAFRRVIVRADTLPRALATAIRLPFMGQMGQFPLYNSAPGSTVVFSPGGAA